MIVEPSKHSPHDVRYPADPAHMMQPPSSGAPPSTPFETLVKVAASAPSLPATGKDQRSPHHPPPQPGDSNRAGPGVGGDPGKLPHPGYVQVSLEDARINPRDQIQMRESRTRTGFTNIAEQQQFEQDRFRMRQMELRKERDQIPRGGHPQPPPQEMQQQFRRPDRGPVSSHPSAADQHRMNMSPHASPSSRPGDQQHPSRPVDQRRTPEYPPRSTDSRGYPPPQPNSHSHALPIPRSEASPQYPTSSTREQPPVPRQQAQQQQQSGGLTTEQLVILQAPQRTLTAATLIDAIITHQINRTGAESKTNILSQLESTEMGKPMGSICECVSSLMP